VQRLCAKPTPTIKTITANDRVFPQGPSIHGLNSLIVLSDVDVDVDDDDVNGS
jgi:hypothetical protein